MTLIVVRAYALLYEFASTEYPMSLNNTFLSAKLERLPQHSR